MFSQIGRKKFAAYAVLLLLDVAVIALSARVNIFQEFYFMADIFPLALSVATLVVLLFTMMLDICSKNAVTARPPFEVGLLYVLSIFWLAFNAFSTVRWRYIPFSCSSIPSDYPDERVWCQDVQALKSLVWILFVTLFFTASFILRYAFLQHRAGHRAVWTSSLSRYDPRASFINTSSGLAGHPAFVGGERPLTITDYFGRNSEGTFMPFDKI